MPTGDSRRRLMLRRSLFWLSICLLGLGRVAPGAGAEAVARPTVAGPQETVFDWRLERCADWDIPDAPARAWRDAAGEVRLVAGAEANRVARGPDLDHLARDCRVVHRGAGTDDPAAYDDASWIASIFTSDGSRVEALAHVEYHGHLRPARCPAARYAPCWRNAITALVSEDGGRSFSRAKGAGGLVAALPYRYGAGSDRREGYFNPSNIVRQGGFLYAFLFAEAFGAQERGPCLIRRPVEGSAGDWRAWDGSGFGVRFADPYREAVPDPGAHVCTPVPGLGSTISSVVRHGPSGRFLAVTPATLRGSDGLARSGIYWTSSTDLIAWSAPELLLEVPLLWRRDCTAPAAYAYPSLIDGASASASFDTVGDDFWLYLVEVRLDDACRAGPERNLVRLPVSLPGG